MIEFKPWPKIPRITNEKFVITEKIDGTNACIVIDDYGTIGAQSRNRIITPQSDNYGFANWVEANKQDLMSLGPGHHFGEWWGKGIGRQYNQTEKHFSLFNTYRWSNPNERKPSCCKIVPVISTFEKTYEIEPIINLIKINGSYAAPGYMNPEGLIIFQLLTQSYYKVIINK